VPTEPVGDVALDGEVGEEGVALEDGVDRSPVGRGGGQVLAVEEDLAAGRRLEAGDEPQGRGLPAPGRAEDREELAGTDLQVDAVDRGE
jgi:hypothetical protein